MKLTGVVLNGPKYRPSILRDAGWRGSMLAALGVPAEPPRLKDGGL